MSTSAAFVLAGGGSFGAIRIGMVQRVMATGMPNGAAVRLSSGPAAEAILASCAIPAAFPAVAGPALARRGLSAQLAIPGGGLG